MSLEGGDMLGENREEKGRKYGRGYVRTRRIYMGVRRQKGRGRSRAGWGGAEGGEANWANDTRRRILRREQQLLDYSINREVAANAAKSCGFCYHFQRHQQ